MFKRGTVFGIFVISVVAMLPTEAMAYSFGGTPTTRVGSGIDCLSIVRGIRSDDQFDALVLCAISIKTFSARCENKGGNSATAEGTVFDIEPAIGVQFGDQFQPLIKFGKFSSIVEITQPEIEENVVAEVSTADICPSGQWHIATGSVEPLTFIADITLFSGADGGCTTGTESTCNEEEFYKLDCELPPGAVDGDLYACDVLEHRP